MVSRLSSHVTRERTGRRNEPQLLSVSMCLTVLRVLRFSLFLTTVVRTQDCNYSRRCIRLFLYDCETKYLIRVPTAVPVHLVLYCTLPEVGGTVVYGYVACCSVCTFFSVLYTHYMVQAKRMADGMNE